MSRLEDVLRTLVMKPDARRFQKGNTNWLQGVSGHMWHLSRLTMVLELKDSDTDVWLGAAVVFLCYVTRRHTLEDKNGVPDFFLELHHRLYNTEPNSEFARGRQTHFDMLRMEINPKTRPDNIFDYVKVTLWQTMPISVSRCNSYGTIADCTSRRARRICHDLHRQLRCD